MSRITRISVQIPPEDVPATVRLHNVAIGSAYDVLIELTRSVSRLRVYCLLLAGCVLALLKFNLDLNQDILDLYEDRHTITDTVNAWAKMPILTDNPKLKGKFIWVRGDVEGGE